MKKINLVLLQLIIFCFSAAGQVKVGMKAGTNFCFISGLGENHKPRIGINAGVFSDISISKKILVQPEVLYTIKGYTFPKTDYSGEGFTNFNYVSVPLMAGYRMSDKLNILLGPEFNFLTTAMSKFDNSKHDITANFNRFELGAGIGATYTEVKGFGLEIRYSQGISNLTEGIITDQLGNELERGGRGHNESLQVGILYIFHYR